MRGFPLSPFVYSHLCDTSILLSFLAITPLTSHPSISAKSKPFTPADRSIGRNSLLRARERCGGGRGVHGYLLFPDSALISKSPQSIGPDRTGMQRAPRAPCRGASFCEQRQKPHFGWGQKLGQQARSKQNLPLGFLAKATRPRSTINAHEGALLCLLGSEETRRDRNPIRSIDLFHLLFS